MEHAVDPLIWELSIFVLMALVPIFVVGIAYIVAGGLTYLLVRAGATTVSGQSTAILIVLMFGAGTGTGTHGVPQMVGSYQSTPSDFYYWVTRTQAYLAAPTPLGSQGVRIES